MSQEFIDRLEKYWDEKGGRPASHIVDLLQMDATEWSTEKAESYDKLYGSSLRKIERLLFQIYVQENEPEGQWLEIIRRPGVTLDISDTLALSVITRWYSVDPMDRTIRQNLLMSIPMQKLFRPSEAGFNTPRIVIGRIVTISIASLVVVLCCYVLWNIIQ